MNPVGFTSQITAGFRAVELQHIADPIICDPLAPFLAGEQGLQTALKDWRELEASHQGPGKHLRVPARNRIVDDALCEALQQLAAAHDSHQQPHAQQIPVQVVNLGCGMDSKPWRLQLPPSCSHLRVRWFDVDQPAVMDLKQQLLQQAGAALASQQSQRQAQQPAPGDVNDSSIRFPLLVDGWAPVAADLARVSLADALGAAGFDTGCCTVWLAEALIYYLPLQNAMELLSEMARLSPPAASTSSCGSRSSGPSRLVATCIDRELYDNHLQLEKQHYFAGMWHFSTEDLLGCSSSSSNGCGGGGSVLQRAGWQLDGPAETSAVLARRRYGKQTYVALYGGAECCFTARLASPCGGSAG